MEDNKYIQMLQLATFFIKMHGYDLINNGQNQQEILLLNKKHHTYPLIRISQTPVPRNENDLAKLSGYKKYLSFLPDSQENILDIHISDEEVSKQVSPSIDEVTIDADHYSGVELKSYYPAIHHQITHITNPEKTMNDLTNDLKLELMSRKKRKHASFFAKFQDKPIASIIICVICIIIWALVNILTKTTGNSSESAIMLGAYYKAFIMAGEWWRLLSSGLVHVNTYHLLMNMVSLINLGRICELTLGRKNYLIILFASVIGGSCFTFALDGNIVAVGLSGGLYGLMGAMIVFAFKTGAIHSPQFRSNLLSTLLINLLINFMPGIGVWAHLGGLVTGVLLAIAFTKKREWRQLRKNTIISSIALCIILGWKMYDNYKIDKMYIASDIAVLEYYSKNGFGGYSQWILDNLSDIYGIDLEVYR